MAENRNKAPQPTIDLNNLDNLPLFLTPAEAASIIRVSPATIYLWAESNFIPNKRLAGLPARTKDGRRRNIPIRIPRDEFLVWLDRLGSNGRKRREKVNQYA